MSSGADMAANPPVAVFHHLGEGLAVRGPSPAAAAAPRSRPSSRSASGSPARRRDVAGVGGDAAVARPFQVRVRLPRGWPPGWRAPPRTTRSDRRVRRWPGRGPRPGRARHVPWRERKPGRSSCWSRVTLLDGVSAARRYRGPAPAGVGRACRRSTAARAAALGLCRSARCSCTRRMDMAPSPTAVATRIVAPWRTSPTAKTPGRLASSG